MTLLPKTSPCSRRVQIAIKEEKGERHEKQEVLVGTNHPDIEEKRISKLKVSGLET